MKKFNVSYKERTYEAAHYKQATSDGRSGNLRAGQAFSTREWVNEKWVERIVERVLFCENEQKLINNIGVFKEVFDLDKEEDILFPVDLDLFGCRDIDIVELTD